MEQVVRPTVRAFWSPDAEDLSTYVPSDPDDFEVFVQISVGADGDDAEEVFSVIVCSPTGFERRLAAAEALPGRHFLFVKRFDWWAIAPVLRAEIEKCEGANWYEVALRINAIARSEFADDIGVSRSLAVAGVACSVAASSASRRAYCCTLAT